MQCCMYVAETHNISLFIYFDSELGVNSDREEDQETKDEGIEQEEEDQAVEDEDSELSVRRVHRTLDWIVLSETWWMRAEVGEDSPGCSRL
jgi:hypothetical protein